MDEIGCLARVNNRKMAVAREGCFSNAASTGWSFYILGTLEYPKKLLHSLFYD